MIAQSWGLLGFGVSIGLVVSPPAALGKEVGVNDSRIAVDEKTGVRIVRGTIEFPVKGSWVIENPYLGQDGLIEVYYDDREAAEEEVERYDGRRSAQLKDRRATEGRRIELSRIASACVHFAEQSDGNGPKKLEELNATGENGASAGVYLVPIVKVVTKVGDDLEYPEERVPMLIDTTPVIDDGKHWIADSRGWMERVEIDPELVGKHGLTIKPQALPHDKRGEAKSDPIKAKIYARVVGDLGDVVLTARSRESGEKLRIGWDTAGARKGTAGLCAEWAELRLRYLSNEYIRESPLVRTWAERILEQYALGGSEYAETNREILTGSEGPGPFRGRTATMVSVFGGRAAIRETLQMRTLEAGTRTEGGEEMLVPSIDVGGIKGVKAKSHPFEEMLNGQRGGSLPLGEWIPADRFMAYFPDPRKLSELVEGGMEILSQVGAGVTNRSVDYELQHRYRDALGLSADLLKHFLDTGAIEELALVMPDLFLIDGTDVSVVMRTGKPLLAKTALALIGVPPTDGQTVKKNKRGEAVYWVRRGSTLVVGTNEEEVKAILVAKESGRSLGTSAELRYMLTQVPVTEDTVVYAYFSDPFVRHLVSPRTKIGQLRRVMARAELEQAAAGALLAKYDGHGVKARDLTFLRDREYLTNPFYASDLVLSEGGHSSSARYGSAGRMLPLSSHSVEKVSPVEKEGYEDYVDDYNQFWRQFFDPIAVRYEQKANGEHALETFILPLIDNSIYEGLREILPAEKAASTLPLPIMEPKPLALLSGNLKEKIWMEVLEDLDDEFFQLLNVELHLLDELGPDVHFAVHDSDPIITIGNGELQQILGGFGQERGGGAETAVMISALTRPATLLVGLRNPGEVRKMLARMTYEDHGNGDGGVIASMSQVADEERWIYKISFEDIATLCFSVEVQDRYLVISNFPFSNRIKVTGSKQAPLGAAHLEFHPPACQKQLSALIHASAHTTRRNAMRGGASLLPLLVSGDHDIGSAQEQHRRMFGFAPVHPGGGHWVWNPTAGEVESSQFGSSWPLRYAPFDPAQAREGLLGKLDILSVGMQFEQDGLRSSVRWRATRPAISDTNSQPPRR